MADELVWQLLPTDGDPYPWTNHQAIKIARVARLLCGASKCSTVQQEVELIIEHVQSTGMDAAESQRTNPRQRTRSFAGSHRSTVSFGDGRSWVRHGVEFATVFAPVEKFTLNDR